MQKELAEILSKNQRKVLEDVFSAKEFVTKTDLIQETGTLSATLEKLRSDTKADLEKLRSDTKADLEKLRSETKADIEKLHSETKAEFVKLSGTIDALRSETKADLEKLHSSFTVELQKTRVEMEKANVTQLRWLVGIGIALATLLIRAFHLFGA